MNMEHFPTLTTSLSAWLGTIPMRASRFSLETPGVHATIPMLRGVWGAALKHLSNETFVKVFEGGPDRAHATPGYILRPTILNKGEETAAEWILFGSAIEHEQTLLRAWDIASGMGLGPERKRFFIRKATPLDSFGNPFSKSECFEGFDYQTWRLGTAPWPLESDPIASPIRLSFRSPLRLLVKHRQIEEPTIDDIIQSGLRRISMISENSAPQGLITECINYTKTIYCLPWKGEIINFHRYSARQSKEIDLRGVCGHIDMPQGARLIWPLLSALRWTHIGKATVFGLGQPIITEL
ncbi:putative CRISPR system precrRNA processing endoribonuclease RAMP protein Cas6 [Azospirillaceae bacterium]